jgi:hypothetical protein
MKRRIAATAATAALAVAGPAVAADRSAQRNGHTPRSQKPRVTRVAAAESANARQALAVMHRQEMAAHRRKLAAALAAELPGDSPTGIALALEQAGDDPAATLARTTGRSEREIDEAFEAMARHAREARLRA